MRQSQTKVKPAFPTGEHLRSLVVLMAAVSVVSTATMAAVGSYGVWRARTVPLPAEQNAPHSLTAAEVREQYLAQRVGLVERLDPYLAGQEAAASNYAELKSIRDGLVALMVPPGEQAHHLELVLALSRFVDLAEPGAKASSAEVTRARQDLTSVLTPLAL